VVLGGGPADAFDPPSGLGEGALDEVGVPYPVVVPGGEAQVGGQALAVGEQDLDRGGVGCPVFGGEFIDAGVDEFHERGAGRRRQIFGVEDLPVGVFDLGLHPGWDLGQ